MKYLIIVSFLFSINYTVAQVDSLGKPNDMEKASALSCLYTFEDFLNTYAVGEEEAVKKTAALKLIKEAVSNTAVSIPNDIDSQGKKELPVLEYAKQVEGKAQGKWFIKLQNFHLNQLAFDKLRRKNFIVIKAEKVTTIESIEAGTGDTLQEEVVQPLHFYLRFDKTQNISSHFRIFAVAKPGEQFTLEPLSEEVQWWLALDKNWQSYFRKTYKLQEYPGQVEVMQLLNRNNISLEGQTFISDLSVLSKFLRLETLNLKGTNTSDLQQIKGLTNLKVLNIEDSKVKSLQGIEGLRKLNELRASRLGLTSIEPVRNLRNLEELYLGENDLEDISALENLANLKKLDLGLNSKIRNVQVLAKLYALQELTLAKIDIKDLSILQKMDQLYKLSIFNTGITTLEPLRVLTKLISLDCAFNVVNSLEPIKGMLFMQQLNIAGTSITDLSVLGNFKYLKSLDCSNNPRLTSLGPVVNLDEMEELKCFHTKIDKGEVQQFKRKHVRSKITFY